MTRKGLRFALMKLGLLAVWTAGIAQQPNETLPGFRMGNVFDAHGIDNINLFSGDPGVVIPLGPEYTLGPSYKWQLKAYYSAKLWTMSGCDSDDTRFAWLRGDPTIGVGWSLQLGYMETMYYQANPTIAFSRGYVSPDGGRHPLEGGASTVDYTKDGTQLRVTASPSFAQPTQYTVEFPDGSIQTFDHTFSAPQSSPVGSPEFSNRAAGVPWNTEKRFGLASVQDSVGNVALTVNYDGGASGGSTEWHRRTSDLWP